MDAQRTKFQHGNVVVCESFLHPFSLNCWSLAQWHAVGLKLFSISVPFIRFPPTHFTLFLSRRASTNLLFSVRKRQIYEWTNFRNGKRKKMGKIKSPNDIGAFYQWTSATIFYACSLKRVKRNWDVWLFVCWFISSQRCIIIRIVVDPSISLNPLSAL